MIPLLFIVIAIGAAGLVAYESSPVARAWIDEHVHALDAAHRAADEYLHGAHTVPDPKVATQRAIDATIANRDAAKRTIDAAKTAKTDAQKQKVAESANVVEGRDVAIRDVFAKLGVGLCDVRSYPRVSSQTKDALLARLHAEGMTVTGDDPWDVDTRMYGVKLRAAWDSRSEELRVVVTAEGPVAQAAGCGAVWGKIDPILKEVMKA